LQKRKIAGSTGAVYSHGAPKQQVKATVSYIQVNTGENTTL